MYPTLNVRKSVNATGNGMPTHKYTSPVWRVWVTIDTVDGLFFSSLTTPEVGIRDKEDLFLGIVMESG